MALRALLLEGFNPLPPVIWHILTRLERDLKLRDLFDMVCAAGPSIAIAVLCGLLDRSAADARCDFEALQSEGKLTRINAALLALPLSAFPENAKRPRLLLFHGERDVYSNSTLNGTNSSITLEDLLRTCMSCPGVLSTDASSVPPSWASLLQQAERLHTSNFFLHVVVAVGKSINSITMCTNVAPLVFRVDSSEECVNEVNTQLEHNPTTAAFICRLQSYTESEDSMAIQILPWSKLVSVSADLRDIAMRFAAKWNAQEDISLNFPCEEYLRGLRQLTIPRVPMVIFGANSCGKSTFVNALLGMPLMPTGSGHVSARITRLTYCDKLADAQVRFVRLNEATLELTTTEQDPISLAHCEDPAQVADALPILLQRPAFTGDAWRNWVTTVVEITYPFDVLKNVAIDVYDLPGISGTDSDDVQKNLLTFLRALSPAMVFLYSNPTFSDAEISCVKFLNSALPPGGQTNDFPICFVNTQVDAAMLIDKYGLQTSLLDATIREKNIRRVMLLDAINDCAQLSRIKVCRDKITLLCVSALDEICEEENRNLTWGDASQRLFQFAATVFEQRLSRAAELLVRIISSLSVSLKGTFQTSYVAEKSPESRSLIQVLENDILKQIDRCLGEVVTQLDTAAKEASEREPAMRAARGINLLLYDGKTCNQTEAEQAAGAMKDRFAPWIHQHVVSPVLMNLQIRLSSQIAERILLWKALPKVRANQLLQEAILAVGSVTDISQLPVHLAIGDFRPILARFIQWSAGYVDKLIAALRLRSEKTFTIDAAFKEKCAAQLLSQIAHADAVSTAKAEYRQELAVWAMALRMRLQSALESTCSRVKESQRLQEENPKGVEERRSMYALLCVESIALVGHLRECRQHFGFTRRYAHGGLTTSSDGCCDTLVASSFHARSPTLEDSAHVIAFAEEALLAWLAAKELPNCGLAPMLQLYAPSRVLTLKWELIYAVPVGEPLPRFLTRSTLSWRVLLSILTSIVEGFVFLLDHGIEVILIPDRCFCNNDRLCIYGTATLGCKLEIMLTAFVKLLALVYTSELSYQFPRLLAKFMDRYGSKPHKACQKLLSVCKQEMRGLSLPASFVLHNSGTA